MDGNFGEQKKEVSAPPPAEISIRTMDSDIKSLGQAGGDIIAPQTFKTEIPQASSVEQDSKNKFEVAGYGGPEKPIFSPMPGVAPKQAAEDINQGRPGWVKFLIIAVVVIVVVAVIGFLTYFVFSKWVFPAQMPSA